MSQTNFTVDLNAKFHEILLVASKMKHADWHGLPPGCMHIDHLKPNGKYIYHLIQQSIILHFVLVFSMILSVNIDYFPKQHVPIYLWMVGCCVFFAVRTEFLNII
jgi:hypothetical protein